jgi:hypothetical protein
MQKPLSENETLALKWARDIIDHYGNYPWLSETLDSKARLHIAHGIIELNERGKCCGK